MGNVGQRALTAAVLAPAAIAAILWLPTPYFAVALGAVVLAAAWEWGRLAGWTAPAPRLIAALGLAGLMLAASALESPAGALALSLAALLWWAVALRLVVRYQRTGRGVPAGVAARLLAGALTLLPAWAALVAVHGLADRGPYWVLALFVLVWAGDTAAFFVGRRWGRRRLASRVSPGKSWEGAVAGTLLAGILAGVVGASAGYSLAAVLGLLLLGVVTVAVSVVGDLSESLFKRDAGLKDSGGLLPGHGGVLDRIDSLTAAAPVYLLGLWALGVRS
jgi:phosphatidate cytidylyltransferase